MVTYVIQSAPESYLLITIYNF